MTRHARTPFGAFAVLSLALVSGGCENLSPGPSLSNIVVSALAKQATIDQKDPALCCCRATGTVTNRNSVPVYVTLSVTALDLKGSAILKVPYFVPDVAPGQTTPIDVPGFVVPCNAISNFVPTATVRGLTEPPL